MELADRKRICSFTIDWEPYFAFKSYGKFWEENDPLIEEPTLYILDLLRRHNIKAIFYVVGWMADKRPDLIEMIKKDGHIIGDHTYYHTYENWSKEKLSDPLFRSPRWHGTKPPGLCGGTFFKILPYNILKNNLLKTKIFWIHPHDILLQHPVCDGFIQNFKRQVGLKTVRDKLERLVRGIEWQEASQPQKS